MNETLMIGYFVGSAIALALLVITNLWTRGDLEQLKDLNQRLRDKWAQTEALCRKLETVALWFLDRENMTVESTGSWATPWLVVGKEKPDEIAKLSDAWAAMYAHREEIAQALYDANLKAMRAFAEEKKAVRRKKND